MVSGNCCDMPVPTDHRLCAPKAPTGLTASSLECPPNVPATDPARASMAFGERPAVR